MRRFYVACDCDLQKAAIRIVKSTAWREMVFSVDTRTCRIELQSGQFFQQEGEDLERNAVFYFRHMCVGPSWRKHGDAVIQAVLHRPSFAALITAKEETGAATVMLSEKTIVPPVQHSFVKIQILDLTLLYVIADFSLYFTVCK